MKPLKILAIGNSFSVDATTYLHQFSLYGKREIIIGNLHFGGCSFAQHLAFFDNDDSPYEYFKNGALKKRECSLREALEDEDWDYITLQQNSGNSGVYETFSPGFDLYKKIKPLTKAQFVIHKTWSYASYYRDEQFRKYRFDQRQMEKSIDEAYLSFARELNIKKIIPSADVFVRAREYFGETLNRDGFHANEKGRYLLAALWYGFFAKERVAEVNFLPLGYSYEENSEQALSQEEAINLREIVDEVLSSYKWF